MREGTPGFVEEENARGNVGLPKTPNTERSNTIQQLDKCEPQATAKLGLHSETEHKVFSLFFSPVVENICFTMMLYSLVEESALLLLKKMYNKDQKDYVRQV